jgi:hypothetical protein
VGLHVTLADKNTNRYKLNETDLRRQIGDQMTRLAPLKEVAWWAITPEELRPWRGDEMNYLRIVSEGVRECDPQRRPIYLYNPNNRDAGSLKTIARYVDALGKGCYVNSTGHKRDRAWVRWSIEQEVAAIAASHRTNVFPLLNPELCADPSPAEDREIRDWVRHDVYLGLASGARGVVIWSLFKRAGVKRTWQRWYDAYAECGRELNGARGLGQVFLFGERRSDLKVSLQAGEGAAHVALGGSAEPETTSAAERAARQAQVPGWTAGEFAYGQSRWLFLVNSANAAATFSLSGWPRGCLAEDAFNGKPVALQQDGVQKVTLPPYGVLGLRLQASQ